jgi:cyclic pyranopterin phosphate synthase
MTAESNDKPSALSHVDDGGRARMVNVSAKDVSLRKAVATAVVTLKPDVRAMILEGRLAKGEALTTARIAGIQAAKETGRLIPMCHPLALDWVHVDIAPRGDAELLITVTAQATARTGVEMEAMMGASVAGLTLYDMAKSADKSITIGPIRLESKSGGKSGDFRRPD